MMNRQEMMKVGAVVAAVLLLFLSVYGWIRLYGLNQARQARFTVEVLSRFIQAYKRSEGKMITRLADLPDFDIISAADSLSFSSADLKKSPVLSGYVYDMQFFSPDKYVISASPMGLFAPAVEYGVTENGQVKTNARDVDVQADSYEEVLGWGADSRVERIRTKELPLYLRN
jgi:hypothetical protein